MTNIWQNTASHYLFIATSWQTCARLNRSNSTEAFSFFSASASLMELNVSVYVLNKQASKAFAWSIWWNSTNVCLAQWLSSPDLVALTNLNSWSSCTWCSLEFLLASDTLEIWRILSDRFGNSSRSYTRTLVRISQKILLHWVETCRFMICERKKFGCS